MLSPLRSLITFICLFIYSYCLHLLRDVSLFSGGGALFWGGHNLFPSCLGEGHNFFQGFLREGRNFFKVFLLKK